MTIVCLEIWILFGSLMQTCYVICAYLWDYWVWGIPWVYTLILLVFFIIWNIKVDINIEAFDTEGNEP